MVLSSSVMVRLNPALTGEGGKPVGKLALERRA
jgi:hypothetical protein